MDRNFWAHAENSTLKFYTIQYTKQHTIWYSVVDDASDGHGGTDIPRGPANRKAWFLMTKQMILQPAVPNEVRRTVLREAEQRYRNELLDDDERQLLLDRIQRLCRKLAS